MAIHDDARPKTRADCIDGLRPCPWISCKHHMIHTNPKWPELTDDAVVDLIERMTVSCVLDVIDFCPEGMSFKQIGQTFGKSKQFVIMLFNGEKRPQVWNAPGILGKLKQRHRPWLEHVRSILAETNQTV